MALDVDRNGVKRMPQSVIVRARQRDEGSIRYPPNHQVGMKVPKGGSNCAKCKFLGEDHKSCKNTYFVYWNGSVKLPAPDEEYCCDFFETAQGGT